MHSEAYKKKEQEAGNHIPLATKEDVEARLRWLQFTEEDEEHVKSCDEIISSHLDQMMDALYSHFLASEETASFFSNPEVLGRAKSAQGKYFRRLTQGNYDTDYVKERWRIGSTHHRIDLAPKWYLGAYCKALMYMQDLLLSNFSSQEFKKVLPSLTKIIFFDMSLAIDTYIMSKEQALRQHRDSIRELETERKVTKGFLEQAPLGIIRLDNELNILECNFEFLNHLDIKDRSLVIGKNLRDLAPHLDVNHFLEALSNGQPYQNQAEPINFSDAMGTDRTFFDWAVWPVQTEENATQGLVAMFANSTDRVKLQQQREDFVATLTHDLKTPILAANRALMLLMEGDFGEVSQAQSDILKTIHQSNDALYQLVLTLLDVYKFDSGAKQLSMGPCDMAEVAERLCLELKPLADNREISLEFRTPEKSEVILADVDEIRRVIQNLVDNSLKFTPAGGTITVAVSYDDSYVIVTVQDTGKGIPDEDKPKLFERFWQSSSGGRYYASTGLGLFLCHKIVEIHGGKISCQSELGRGSTFTIKLPKMSF
jgi:signal transduction histidine kinase